MRRSPQTCDYRKASQWAYWEEFSANYLRALSGREQGQKGFESRDLQNTFTESHHPSQTKWASQIECVLKKDGSVRFCVSYKKRNAVTKRDWCAILRMKECIDFLRKATVFFNLDANSGYRQDEVEKGNRDKTALTSHHELYRLVQVPFRKKDVPKTFWGAVDLTVSPIKRQFVLVCLGDIVVCSSSPRDNVNYVKQVSSLFRDVKAILKLKKCNFFAETFVCFGHVICPQRLRMATHTTDAIKWLPSLKNVTNVCLFIRLCNLFRRFTPNFARIASQLNKNVEERSTKTFWYYNSRGAECRTHTTRETGVFTDTRVTQR